MGVEFVDFERIRTELNQAIESTRRTEANLRGVAAALGRSPEGLALNALATDAWKLSAGLLALANGHRPMTE
mgnify:CR=1 FL=1